MSSAGSKLNREKRRRATTYRRGYEDGVAAKDALSAAEPVAWLVKRYDLSGVLLDTELSFTRPSIKSTCRTEMAPLYAAPLAPSVAVKDFETNKEMLTAFRAEDIREGSRMCFEADGTDTWEDYYEVPLHTLDRIRSALSAQVQDVAGSERLRDVTYAIQHNPNCPAKYLVRLVGESGRIDLKPYGNHLPRVKHETGDILGFGKTLDEAIDNALAAAAPAKQEG